MASEFDQIPFGIYGLDHTAFFVNVINYVDEFLKMNNSGIPGINPVWSRGFALMMQDLIPFNRKSPSFYVWNNLDNKGITCPPGLRKHIT